MKRLNGWQRIGIILSVIWIIGGGFLIHGTVKDELQRDADWQWGVVAKLSSPDQLAVKAGDYSKMSDSGRLMVKASIGSEVNTWTAVWIFVPLLLAWLLVYGLVGLTRWVGAGFRKASERRKLRLLYAELQAVSRKKENDEGRS